MVKQTAAKARKYIRIIIIITITIDKDVLTLSGINYFLCQELQGTVFCYLSLIPLLLHNEFSKEIVKVTLWKEGRFGLTGPDKVKQLSVNKKFLHAILVTNKSINTLGYMDVPFIKQV